MYMTAYHLVSLAPRCQLSRMSDKKSNLDPPANDESEHGPSKDFAALPGQSTV